MDLKQRVVQRACEFFGNRFSEILSLIQQDRQALRGWEEPAHLRAVLRRSVHQSGSQETVFLEEVEIPETDSLRRVGEPEPGQQREALGRILEMGAAALEKVSRNQAADLTAEELVGLECIEILYGRPSLLIRQGRLESVPASWKILESQREAIELVQRGIGRIELLGHPEYDWAGTGFLVHASCLITTRRIAELFLEQTQGQWQFRPGISAWMDYQPHAVQPPSATYRIHGVLGVHSQYDLALLRVEPPQQTNGTPVPLVAAAQAPPRLEGRPVYLIGYPVRDSRRNDPEFVARTFRDTYNVKRLQPGVLRGVLQFHEVQLLQHDCAMLGHAAGSCLVDLETHQVLGLHLAGRYLDMGSAIPLWNLRGDPLFQQAGIRFAEATSQDVQTLTSQLEHLARSQHWAEARSAIHELYQRAFGHKPGTNG